MPVGPHHALSASPRLTSPALGVPSHPPCSSCGGGNTETLKKTRETFVESASQILGGVGEGLPASFLERPGGGRSPRGFPAAALPRKLATRVVASLLHSLLHSFIHAAKPSLGASACRDLPGARDTEHTCRWFSAQGKACTFAGHPFVTFRFPGGRAPPGPTAEKCL